MFAITVVTVVGVFVGTLAVAGPGIFDRVLMRVTDIAYAFPDLLLIILLRSAFGTEIFGQSEHSRSRVEHLVDVPCDLADCVADDGSTRSRTATFDSRDGVHAGSGGAGRNAYAGSQMRHWLPNSMGPVIVEATFLIPRAIFAEAALSFIGVGVSPPTPSLGLLINEHFDFVLINWTGLFFPTACCWRVLFIAFSFFGDGLRDALDPRSRRTA